MASKWINVILWTLLSVNVLTLVLGGLITWLGYAIPVRLNQYGLLPEIAIAGGFAALLVACLGICALNYSSHYALNVYGFSCSIFILLMMPGIIPDTAVKTIPGNSSLNPSRLVGSHTGNPNRRHLLLDVIYFALIFLLAVLLVFAHTLAHYLRRKEASYGHQTMDDLEHFETHPPGGPVDLRDLNNQVEFIQTNPHNITPTMAATTTTTNLPPKPTTYSRQLYEPNELDNINVGRAARPSVCSPSGAKLSLDSLDCTCTMDEIIQQQLLQQPMGSNQNCCLSRRTTSPIIDQNNQNEHNQHHRQQPRQPHDLANNDNNNKLGLCKRQEHRNDRPSNQLNQIYYTHQHLSNNNNKLELQTAISTANHINEGDGGNNHEDHGGGGGGSHGVDDENDANIGQLDLVQTQLADNELFGKQYNVTNSFKSESNYSCCSNQREQDKPTQVLDEAYDNLQQLICKGIYTREEPMLDDWSSQQRSKSLPRKSRQTIQSLLADTRRGDILNMQSGSNIAAFRDDNHSHLIYHPNHLNQFKRLAHRYNHQLHQNNSNHFHGRRNNQNQELLNKHRYLGWARHDTIDMKPVLCHCPLFVERSRLYNTGTLSDQNNNNDIDRICENNPIFRESN